MIVGVLSDYVWALYCSIGIKKKINNRMSDLLIHSHCQTVYDSQVLLIGIKKKLYTVVHEYFSNLGVTLIIYPVFFSQELEQI